MAIRDFYKSVKDRLWHGRSHAYLPPLPSEPLVPASPADGPADAAGVRHVPLNRISAAAPDEPVISNRRQAAAVQSPPTEVDLDLDVDDEWLFTQPRRTGNKRLRAKAERMIAEERNPLAKKVEPATVDYDPDAAEETVDLGEYTEEKQVSRRVNEVLTKEDKEEDVAMGDWAIARRSLETALRDLPRGDKHKARWSEGITAAGDKTITIGIAVSGKQDTKEITDLAKTLCAWGMEIVPEGVTKGGKPCHIAYREERCDASGRVVEPCSYRITVKEKSGLEHPLDKLKYVPCATTGLAEPCGKKHEFHPLNEVRHMLSALHGQKSENNRDPGVAKLERPAPPPAEDRWTTHVRPEPIPAKSRILGWLGLGGRDKAAGIGQKL